MNQTKLIPSVGRLFHFFEHLYSKGVGVILTGMGKDGVQDLLYMKQKGAVTIAQDEVGCTMFGTIDIGAAKHVVA